MFSKDNVCMSMALTILVGVIVFMVMSPMCAKGKLAPTKDEEVVGEDVEDTPSEPEPDSKPMDEAKVSSINGMTKMADISMNARGSNDEITSFDVLKGSKKLYTCTLEDSFATAS